MLQPSWTGRRVSVRRGVARTSAGAPRFGDVVGDLLLLDDAVALIETRRGRVEVAVPSIVAARLVDPSTADELAVAEVAARGWRAAETSTVGGWLLRANGGFTNRANSVLALRPAALPLAEALAQARAWYVARGLPLRIQLPCRARRLLDAELAKQGFAATPEVHVMTARLDMLAVPDAPTEVAIATSPDDGWLRCYRAGAAAVPGARELLTRHDRVAFAAVRRDDTVVAVGRGVVDDGWLGVSAVEVAPEHRRQGLARAVMAALCGWGRAQGARRSYLQVAADNAPALALYTQLGYWTHHDYRYRLDPAS